MPDANCEVGRAAPLVSRPSHSPRHLLQLFKYIDIHIHVYLYIPTQLHNFKYVHKYDKNVDALIAV